MITIPIQVRPSDQDSLGHVNNAAYVAYVQHAVAEYLAQNGFGADWLGQNEYQWMMQELAIEYRLAATFRDQLVADVWLIEAGGNRAVFGCELRRTGNGQQPVIIRGRSHWQRQNFSTGQAVELPEVFAKTAGQETGELPRPFKAPGQAEKVRRYQWRHTVQRSEVGLGDRAHPHVLFEWIEESILDASKEAGWPIERLLAADFVVFQMRHDANFYSLPERGEAVEVASRLVNARRLRGTWHNEIRSQTDNRLLASNYSTGIFLNLAGRPTPPPPGMIEAMQETIA